MDFARARTREQVISRQEEIINACDTLFSQEGYDGVNFKALSAMTSITRPSLYNYYETKDEVLLDLLKREILRWQTYLNDVIDATPMMTKEQYSAYLTQALLERWKLGELFSLQYPILQRKCSEQKLADFSKIISQLHDTFTKGLDKYFPAASPENKTTFIIAFFAYVRGLYPMSNLFPKKRKTTRKARADDPVDFQQMCYQGILLLLSNL